MAYHDSVVNHFLEIGWPISYTAIFSPRPVHRNNPSVVKHAQAVKKFIHKEITLHAATDPFANNSFLLSINDFSLAHSTQKRLS